MEEEFEEKSGKKALKVLIPIIILIILLGAGAIYYYTINTPRNIFSKAIEKAIEKLEEPEYNSYKGDLELSMKLESDNQDIQTLNLVLNNLKIRTNQEIDLKDKNMNNVITVNFLGDDLINLEFVEQDAKMYFFEKSIFSKYIELPTEEIETEVGYNTFEVINQAESFINKENLKEISKIIISEIKDKEYTQSKEELTINGEKIKTAKSTLRLTTNEIIAGIKNILNKVKENEKIMSSFTNREEVKNNIESIVENIGEIDLGQENETLEISLYTKGRKQDIVKVEVVAKDNEAAIELDITKFEDDKYVLNVLENETTIFNLKLENEKKDKKSGTLTATLDLTNIMSLISSSDEYGATRAILKVKYNEEYNNKIEKADVQNSVKLEELTEEDLKEIEENIQKSNWYTLLEKSGLFGDIGLMNNEEVNSEFYKLENTLEDTNPEVTLEGHTVKYSVPENFKLTTSQENQKYYLDENINSVTVKIDKETKENYFELLKEVDALTADFYKNQEISGIKTVTVGDKEISYRTINYTYDDINYEDTYYCYEIEKGILYTVETSIEKNDSNNIDINKFLEINL